MSRLIRRRVKLAQGLILLHRAVRAHSSALGSNLWAKPRWVEAGCLQLGWTQPLFFPFFKPSNIRGIVRILNPWKAEVRRTLRNP